MSQSNIFSNTDNFRGLSYFRQSLKRYFVEYLGPDWEEYYESRERLASYALHMMPHPGKDSPATELREVLFINVMLYTAMKNYPEHFVETVRYNGTKFNMFIMRDGHPAFVTKDTYSLFYAVWGKKVADSYKEYIEGVAKINAPPMFGGKDPVKVEAHRLRQMGKVYSVRFDEYGYEAYGPFFMRMISFMDGVLSFNSADVKGREELLIQLEGLRKAIKIAPNHPNLKDENWKVRRGAADILNEAEAVLCC